jgi:septation ring formation regulator EzrA
VDSISKHVANSGKELVNGNFIQNAEQIIAQSDNVEQIKRLMETIPSNILLTATWI